MQTQTVRRLGRRECCEFDFVVKDPKLVVGLGEVFVVETEDNLGGVIRSENDVLTDEFLATRQQNPCSGPIVVEGVKAGDLLLIRIHDVVVNDYGFTILQNLWGPAAGSVKYADCTGPYTRIIRHLPGPSGTTSDGRAVFNDQISWEIKPVVGVLAVSPLRPIAEGANATYGQGPWGGNIDSPAMCKGSTVMLPVSHDGAYLYLGDVDASMGDAEWSGMANNAKADVTLSCDRIANKSIPWMRIETEDEIVQLYSFKPLDRAIHQAYYWLLEWLVEDYGFSQREAYLMLGVNPDVTIHVWQMTNYGRLNYTVGVSIPKKYLI